MKSSARLGSVSRTMSRRAPIGAAPHASGEELCGNAWFILRAGHAPFLEVARHALTNPGMVPSPATDPTGTPSSAGTGRRDGPMQATGLS